MFRATIIRVDDSFLHNEAEVVAENSKRGTGEGHIWRGFFVVPPMYLRPTIGETIYFRLEDNSQIGAVVTEVEGHRIYFRARGCVPKDSVAATEILR